LPKTGFSPLFFLDSYGQWPYLIDRKSETANPEETMIEAGRNLEEAKRTAIRLSKENPGKYVTLFACFGLFAEIRSRLHVFAPSDSSRVCDCYWLNGTERRFTEKQWAADWEATPEVS